MKLQNSVIRLGALLLFWATVFNSCEKDNIETAPMTVHLGYGIEGEVVYIEKEAYTMQLPNYLRMDVSISMNRALPCITHGGA